MENAVMKEIADKTCKVLVDLVKELAEDQEYNSRILEARGMIMTNRKGIILGAGIKIRVRRSYPYPMDMLEIWRKSLCCDDYVILPCVKDSWIYFRCWLPSPKKHKKIKMLIC